MKDKFEKLAESMSLDDYEVARDEYRAKGDLLFYRWSPDAETYGEHVARQLRSATEALTRSVAKAELLSPDDWEAVENALLLPINIHCAEYTYVGSGGNCREDPRFDIEEIWQKSDETVIRDSVIDALYKYCLASAATAKRLHATLAQRLLMRALYVVETSCRSCAYENAGSGCSKSDAESVVAAIHRASCLLWAELQVEAEENVLKRQIDEQKAKSSNKKQPQEPEDTFYFPEPIKLGPWAAKIVKPVKSGSDKIQFFGNPGKKLTISRTRKVAWLILQKVLTATDPKGWVELPPEMKKWTNHFRVDAGVKNEKGKKIADPTSDFTWMRHHIEANNKKGERGKKTMIRLRKSFNATEFRKVEEEYDKAKKIARAQKRKSGK